jgi:hypothetical protein
MSSYKIKTYDGFGSGLISPDCTKFFVNIPKNASSYMVDILSRQGWTSCQYGRDNNKVQYNLVNSVIVVMRDPVDRWVSGVSQFLTTRILNFMGPETYIDFDNHTIKDQYLHFVKHEDSPLTGQSFMISYSPLIERFIFDQLDALDDHVWPQHIFLDDILPDVKRQIIVMDDNFESNLNNLGIQTYPDADRNSSSIHPDKDLLKHFFKTRLQFRPDRLEMVTDTYERDFELIRNAK